MVYVQINLFIDRCDDGECCRISGAETGAIGVFRVSFCVHCQVSAVRWS